MAAILAALSTVQLLQPLSRYRLDVPTRLRAVTSELSTLRSRIAAGDLRGARAAWLAAHLAWLEIGQNDGSHGTCSRARPCMRRCATPAFWPGWLAAYAGRSGR